jgi:hypothetical protein
MPRTGGVLLSLGQKLSVQHPPPTSEDLAGLSLLCPDNDFDASVELLLVNGAIARNE